MSAPHPSRSARFASFWMQLALRFWPAESRDWGRALAAEIDCIHSPFEALRWALGGTLLFGRALVSHSLAWLQLPIGTHINGGQVLPSTQLPRRSRLFSGALLVTTAAVLCLPQGREAFSAVKRSWGFSDYRRDDEVLERIAKQADRENDARTLAFVGLALPHLSCCPLRDRRDTTYYADRAVAIDPFLTWIYTGMVRPYGFRTDQSEWMTRLKASDPENAFPYLLSAEAILNERYGALIYRNSPTDLEVQASVEHDAHWLGDMARAIRTRRLDTYSKNFFDLFRAFYSRNPSLEPFTYLEGSLGSRPPSDFSLKVYVSILTRQAGEARSVESFTTATGELKRVVQFSELVAQRRESEFNGYFDRPAIQALRGLKDALVQRGNTEEAAVVGDHLQRFEQQQKHRKSMCMTRSGFGRLERTGLVVHSLGFGLILFSCLFLASIAILEIPFSGQWRLRSFLRMPACLIADLCPALLVLTGVAFLYSYLPFARAFKAQLSQSQSLFDLNGVWATYWSLRSLPAKISQAFDWLFEPFYQWVFVTALLALLALFLVARGFVRTRRPFKV